jgi:hypothetical protein
LKKKLYKRKGFRIKPFYLLIETKQLKGLSGAKAALNLKRTRNRKK